LTSRIERGRVAKEEDGRARRAHLSGTSPLLLELRVAHCRISLGAAGGDFVGAGAARKEDQLLVELEPD
jgi:hypothetical protein